MEQQQQRDINTATHLIGLCPSSSLSHRGQYRNESENGPQGPMHNRHLLTASQNNTCHRGEPIISVTWLGIPFEIGHMSSQV